MSDKLSVDDLGKYDDALLFFTHHNIVVKHELISSIVKLMSMGKVTLDHLISWYKINNYPEEFHKSGAFKFVNIIDLHFNRKTRENNIDSKG